MKRVIIVYEQYGNWSCTTPFASKAAAEKHARNFLLEQTHMAPEFRSDRSYKKHVQYIEIDIDEDAVNPPTIRQPGDWEPSDA